MGRPKLFAKTAHSFIRGTLKNLDLAETRLIFALQLYRDWETGICYPKYRDLENDTGLSKRSLYRAMEGLENYGLVERIDHKPHSGKRNKYAVASLMDADIE